MEILHPCKRDGFLKIEKSQVVCTSEHQELTVSQISLSGVIMTYFHGVSGTVHSYHRITLILKEEWVFLIWLNWTHSRSQWMFMAELKTDPRFF